jgi:hypothetical protein
MKLDVYCCNEKFNIILGLGYLKNSDISLNRSLIVINNQCSII